jgi:hypothetical protein
MVHSIQAPYFDDRYRAESFVLKATTYFQMCHFDRGRKALDEFFRIYEPMSEQLKPWLEGDKTDAEMVDAHRRGRPQVPGEIRNQILFNRRFKKFLASGARGGARDRGRPEELPRGRVQGLHQRDAEGAARPARTSRASWSVSSSSASRQFLDDFLNQGRIIKFETADAERKMLEAGKDITKGPRARGPRPNVPNASYQYWAFLGEYWIDELGFYEHSIKNECLSEVFE